MTSALRVFHPAVLNKILAFSIYLLGAKRRTVADLVGMSDESVKTAVRFSFFLLIPVVLGASILELDALMTLSSSNLLFQIL